MKPHKPFSALGQTTIPLHLEGQIRARIITLERRGFFVRMSVMIAVAAASLAGLVASCIYAWTAAASSGLGEYISIIFSDGSAALSYSKELGFAILESTPMLGVALALAAALALAWSLAGLIKNNHSSYEYAR